MNTLIEETARFLSRSNSPFIREKSLTPDEIVDLMDKGEEVANAISKDSKKDPEERETARDVLSWIKDVRATWKKNVTSRTCISPSNYRRRKRFPIKLKLEDFR